MDYARPLLYIVLLSSLFFLPWWCVYFFALGYAVYYTPSYEIVFLGFVADGVYGVLYMHTLIAAVVCIGVYTVRSYIRV